MDQIGPIALDAMSTDPLYRQLFDSIAGRIENGALTAGHRLPPTRSLAGQLGTHRNTVVRAYRALEEAGFVESTVGRGTFVRDVPAAGGMRPRPAAGGIPWASLFSEASGAESLGRAERLMRGEVPPAGIINLARMEPAGDLLASDQLKRCLDHVMRSQGPRALGYAPRGGVPRLRALIAEDLLRNGVSAQTGDIQVTSGSQQGLDLLARVLCDPGDAVIVNGSTYAGALHVLQAAGVRLISVPNDDEGPSMVAMQRLAHSGAKAVYLMPNCQNPTGLCISQQRRAALVQWSQRSGVPLIEDDYVSDLHLDEQPPPAPMRALDGDVIYIGTYSKKLIPALRVGYVVAPEVLRLRLEVMKKTMDLGTSALMQHALAEFLERGYLRAHLARIVPEYRKRREALLEGLRQEAPADLLPRRPIAGLILWVPLPARLDPELVYDRCLRAGVLVMPSTMQHAGEGSERGIRLAFCAESEPRLRQAGQRVGKVLRELLQASTGSERMQSMEVI